VLTDVIGSDSRSHRSRSDRQTSSGRHRSRIRRYGSPSGDDSDSSDDSDNSRRPRRPRRRDRAHRRGDPWPSDDSDGSDNDSSSAGDQPVGSKFFRIKLQKFDGTGS